MRLRKSIGLTLIPLLLAAAYASDVRRPVAITSDLIAPHLQFLAGDECAGRRTGEKGNEIAARYIAEHFRRVGLKPVGTSRQRDPRAPMNGSGYYQPFTFTAGSAKGKANELMATVNGRKRRYTVGRDFEPHTAASKGSVESEVVFVGFGRRGGAVDDYEGVDVKGKVVLALSPPEQSGRARFAGFEVQRKIQAARDAGAAALLIALPSSEDKPRFNSSARPGDSGIPVVQMRKAVAEEWLSAAGKSLEETEKAAAEQAVSTALPVRVKVSTEVVKSEGVSANIIGLLPGSDPELSREYVIIGAHMDHLGLGGAGSLAPNANGSIHHGADDNASGTAGVMALAEYFASQPTRPKRSLLFMAFSGEEQGLLGSAHYVRNPIVPLEQTVAMLNMDMIGRMQNNRLSVIGVGTSSIWSSLLDEVNAKAGFTLAKSNSGFGGSDHQSFYRGQVPVLFFFTGTHPDYHKPSDTFDKINLADQTRVVEMVADLAERVADAAERPPYVQMGSGAAPSGGPPRLRASLGIMPEYDADAAGVRVGGLRRNGPAEKAGIKEGDVITRLADKSVRNIEEYMAVLADKRPGDRIAVTVVRDGKELTFTLTLAESVR